MGVQKTGVSILSKVKSLGASFFQKYVTTKDMNKKIAEMNKTGVIEIIKATASDTTTDFGSLEVGDMVYHLPAAAGNARAGECAVVATSPFAAVANDFYIIIRPGV